VPKPWIGVDFDGTLAIYDKWRGSDHVGEPIPAMVDRVKAWHGDGKIIKIFTSRTGDEVSEQAINRWCMEHLGFVPPITNVKDRGCEELWDDRARQVEKNTGRLLSQ